MANISLAVIAASIFFIGSSNLTCAKEDTTEYTREDLKQLYVGLVTAEEIMVSSLN